MAFLRLAALLGVVALTSANINITSPPITNWGQWGNFERCPFGRNVQGFQLKTEPNQYLGDDTALNAIRLFCGDPYRPDTAVITSWVGDFGEWGNVYTCFPGVLTGFQLRVESDRGSGDDTATNNARFFCSSLPNPNDYIQGDGMSWGDWSEAQHCYGGQAICGIQTQIEPYMGNDGDDTMLNNVRLECCDYRVKDLEADYERVKEMGVYPQVVNPKFAGFIRKAVLQSQEKSATNEKPVGDLSILAKAVRMAIQEKKSTEPEKEANSADLKTLVNTITEAVKKEKAKQGEKPKAGWPTLSKTIVEALKQREIEEKSKPNPSFAALSNAIVTAIKKQELVESKKPKPSLALLGNEVAEAIQKQKAAKNKAGTADVSTLGKSISEEIQKRKADEKTSVRTADLGTLAKAVSEAINNQKLAESRKSDVDAKA